MAYKQLEYLLLRNEGLPSETRKAFIVYLISHPRPVLELLNPRKKDIRDIYEKEFRGMLLQDIPAEILEDVINDLVKIIREELTMDERRFIVSIKEGYPEWDLLELEGIKDLPAVKWKLLNISKMEPEKHREAFEKLKEYLGI